MKAAKAEITRVAAGAGLSGVWSVAGYLLGFAGTAIITRAVGPAAFGSVAVGMAVVGIFQILATWGMDRGLLKYVSFYLGAGGAGSLRRVVRSAALLCVASSALLVCAYLLVGAPWVQRIFPQLAGAGPVVTAFVLFGAAPALALLYTSALTALQRPQYGQFAASVVRPVVQVSATLLLATWVSGVVALTAATIAAYLAALLALFLFFRSALRADLGPAAAALPEPAESRLGSFVRFCLPLSLVPVLNYAGFHLDVLLVGSFLGDESAGVYAVVRRVGDLTLLPLIVFGGVTAATVSKCLAQGRISEVRPIYQFTTKWVSIGSIAIFTVSLTAPREFLAVFGKEFAKGALPLQVLALGQLVNSAVGPSGSTLLVMGRERLVVLNSLVGAGLGLGLLLLLVPLHGLLGAAVAVAVATSAVNLLSAAQLYYLEHLPPAPTRAMLSRAAATALALIAAGVAGSLVSEGPARLAVVSLAALAVAGPAAVAMEGIGDLDRALLTAWRRRLPGAAGGGSAPFGRSLRARR